MSKELSKEERPIEIWNKYTKHLSWGETQLCQNPGVDAMREYAKQEAIVFAVFCVDWFEENGKVEPYKRWRSVKNGEEYTTNGVYELYQKK